MVYKCKMCGQLYDDAVETVRFADLPDSWCCPICGAPKSLFEVVEQDSAPVDKATGETPVQSQISDDVSFIQTIASTGKDVIEPAGAVSNITDWSKVLLLGAQLANKPLDESVEAKTKTIIGASAVKPMELDSPIIVSHMSYGALSTEQKVAIAQGAATIGTAVSTGEGGLLEDELTNAHRVIFEYIPNKYSATDENLRRVDAIEIKIGQSAKPGLGGHLPGAKVTAEIAKVRGVKVGEDIISPPAFSEINTPSDLKSLVDELRQRSGGRPIGIKIAANKIEPDIDWIIQAGADFMTIDGRGGGTGAAPRLWRDTAGVPTLYALIRTRQALDKAGSTMQLIVTGGLRTAADFAKCLALGADAVAVATGVLTAMAAPGKLSSEQKVANYLGVSNQQLKLMARAMGYDNIHNLSIDDVATIDHDIATHTPIKHV